MVIPLYRPATIEEGFVQKKSLEIKKINLETKINALALIKPSELKKLVVRNRIAMTFFDIKKQ